MAKVKVRDNRGQARKKAKIAQYGKMMRVQKVGSHKLAPAAPRGGGGGGGGGGRSANPRPASSEPSRRPHNPYAKDGPRRVLLLGEGDFSFGAALATLWGGQCEQLVATTLESEASVLAEGEAADNVEMIRAGGGRVLFGIDATSLCTSAPLAVKRRFDRVVFNFPLAAGAGSGRDPQAATQANQALVRAVCSNAAAGGLLVPGGELHIALPRGAPFDGWGVPMLARLCGLRVKSAVPFSPAVFPGYSGGHAAGAGALTYEFVVPDRASQAPEAGGKKKFDGDAAAMNKQRRRKGRKP